MRERGSEWKRMKETKGDDKNILGDKESNFFLENTYLLHMCETCSELPSYISTKFEDKKTCNFLFASVFDILIKLWYFLLCRSEALLWTCVSFPCSVTGVTVFLIWFVTQLFVFAQKMFFYCIDHISTTTFFYLLLDIFTFIVLLKISPSFIVN